MPPKCRKLPGRRPGVKQLSGRRRLEETAQVGLADRRLASGYVVESALEHPPFELTNELEQVVEGFHREQERLLMIDLEILIDHPFELDGIPLDFRRLDRVGDLAV